jgi:hypothetical protein
MTCKKCGGEMRFWLLRPGIESFAPFVRSIVSTVRCEAPLRLGKAAALPAQVLMPSMIEMNSGWS